MALNPKLIVTSDLEGLFRNKDTALPLANGYILFFSDVSRNVAKSVYQLNGYPIYGYVDIGSRVTLSAIGTPENNNGDNIVIYYYPYVGTPSDNSSDPELYYVEVYDENNNLQFTREAWPNPQSGGSTPPTDATVSEQNQISNPSFTNIFLNPGVNTFTLTGAVQQVIPIAPDWDLIVSGTGTVAATREEIAGSAQIPTSPPYDLFLDISSGITLCRLRQRFQVNSGLWSTTSAYPLYLTGAFVAQHTTPTPVDIIMFFAPSGLSPVQVFTASVDTNFQFFGGTSGQIAFSTDANVGAAGFVDIYLEMPLQTSFRISSINIFPSNSVPDTILPTFDSTNRNLDYQSNYYTPRLVAKAAPSYLIGWDFPLNPFQIAQSGSITSTYGYIADQTIAGLVSGSVGTLAYQRDSVTNGLSLNSTGGATFFILQYLSGATVKEMIGKKLSVNLRAYKIGSGTVTAKIYLCRSNNPPPLLPAINGTVALNGTFTPGAGWTVMPRNGLDNYPIPIATLNESNAATRRDDGSNDFGFSGWKLTDDAQAASSTSFAILVVFQGSPGTLVTVDSVSVVGGDLPCLPSPQSPDDVLRECQFYYEKTYDTLVPPGTGGGSNIGNAIDCFQPVTPTTTSPVNVVASAFSFLFNSVKRTNPNIVLYNPLSGAANNVEARIMSSGLVANSQGQPISKWVPLAVNTKGVNVSAALNGKNAIASFGGSPTDGGIHGFILFHYTADARLGII